MSRHEEVWLDFRETSKQSFRRFGWPRIFSTLVSNLQISFQKLIVTCWWTDGSVRLSRKLYTEEGRKHGQKSSKTFRKLDTTILKHIDTLLSLPQLDFLIDIMSSINRSLRTASKNIRIPGLQLRAVATAPLILASRTKSTAPRNIPSSTYKQFSTMGALQSGAPPPPQQREYDPEIKDIASYVHNTPIDSELAVCWPHYHYQEGSKY